MSATEAVVAPFDAFNARNEELLTALSATVETQGLRFDAWAVAQASQLQLILSELQGVDGRSRLATGGDWEFDGSSKSGMRAEDVQLRPVPGFASVRESPQAEVQVPPISSPFGEPAPRLASAPSFASLGEARGASEAAPPLGSPIPVPLPDPAPADIGALALAKGWMVSASKQAKKRTVAKQPWLWKEWPLGAELLQNPLFEYGVAILILANAVIMGLEADRQLKNIGKLTAADDVSGDLQDVCTVLFCLELLLRMLAYRMLLFTRDDAHWNMFDIVCMSFGLVELAWKEMGSQGSLVRTMRIPRVLRVLRVFRLSRFFREIRLMMYMIMCSFRSLFWMMLLLVLLVYIVGVALAKFIISHMQEVNAADLESVGIPGIENFADVSTCMFTLLKAAFGGDDWGQYFDVLSLVGYEASTLFLAYMACMLMAILNVITGVFVDNTMASVRDDRDLAIAEELNDEASTVQNLKHLFRTVQSDKNTQDFDEQNDPGELEDHTGVPSDMRVSEAEFYTIIVHEKVRAYFAVMGLDVTHAEGLFKLLDQDSSGKVGLEEFVMGCLRLKGEAKAVDVATIMYENKRIMQKLNHVSERNSHDFRQLYQAIHQDISLFGKHLRLPASGQATTRFGPAICTRESSAHAEGHQLLKATL